MSSANSKENSKDEVTIDSLYAEYDAIIDQGLNEKSDEYQELREKIRMFIEEKNLDVRISRTKNNIQLLEEIEDAIDSLKNQPKDNEEEEEESAPAPARTRAPKPKAEAEEEEDEQPAADEDEEPASEAPRRTTRARPGSDAEEASATEPEEAEEEAPAEDTSRRRRRLR